METSIFLDSLSVNGINVEHQNGTLTENTGKGVSISSSKVTNASWNDEPSFSQNDGSQSFSSHRSSLAEIE